MSLQIASVLSAVVLFVCFSNVSPLKCVECTSLMDEKCGITFGYSEIPKTMLTECEGDVVACKKLQHKEVHKETTVVTRSCWNTTSEAEMKDVLGCNEMDLVTSCYCTSDDSCNGGQHMLPSLVLLGLAALVGKLILH